jgi:bifunctional DNA-binding transcriptional regulator/antitoxin component of YhaV-PrlF toxin-antitoxin module
VIRQSLQINAEQVLCLIVDHGRSFIVMKSTSDDEDSRIIGFVNQSMGVINTA